MGVFRSLKGEMRKLDKRKKYNVFFILFLLAYLIGRVIAHFSGLNAESGVVMGNSLLVFYLPFIAFLGVNDLLASEIHDRSIQQCLVRPVSRMSVYFAKILAVIIKCARHALWLTAIDYGFMLIGLGSGSPLQAAYLMFDLIPLCTLIAFAALISVLVHSPALSMLFALVLYAALMVSGSFLGLSPVLFTSYLNWHTMLHGGLNPIGFLERFLAVTAPGAAFLMLGAIALERKRF